MKRNFLTSLHLHHICSFLFSITSFYKRIGLILFVSFYTSHSLYWLGQIKTSYHYYLIQLIVNSCFNFFTHLLFVNLLFPFLHFFFLYTEYSLSDNTSHIYTFVFQYSIWHCLLLFLIYFYFKIRIIMEANSLNGLLLFCKCQLLNTTKQKIFFVNASKYASVGWYLSLIGIYEEQNPSWKMCCVLLTMKILK